MYFQRFKNEYLKTKIINIAEQCGWMPRKYDDGITVSRNDYVYFIEMYEGESPETILDRIQTMAIQARGPVKSLLYELAYM